MPAAVPANHSVPPARSVCKGSELPAVYRRQTADYWTAALQTSDSAPPVPLLRLPAVAHKALPVRRKSVLHKAAVLRKEELLRLPPGPVPPSGADTQMPHQNVVHRYYDMRPEEVLPEDSFSF